MRHLGFSAALLVSSLLASPAVYADPCEGDKLDAKTLSAGATDIGQLEVFYDRENKEYCTELKHVGVTVGKPTYTRVSIAECKDWSCREVVAPVRFDDGADYVEKAGPTRLKAKPRGQCVIASGTMTFDKETQTVRGRPLCR